VRSRSALRRKLARKSLLALAAGVVLLTARVEASPADAGSEAADARRYFTDEHEVASSSAGAGRALLVEDEAAGRVGLFLAGNRTNTVYDLFVTPGVFGRLRWPSGAAVLEHLYAEADLTATLAAGTSAAPSLVAQLRLGVAFQPWALALGLWSNSCLACAPEASHAIDGPRSAVQLLPSVVARWQPASWGLSLGLFDQPLGLLAHLSFDWRDWSVGYSFPLGGTLAWRPRLTRRLALEVQLLGFTIAGSFQAGGSVGLRWLPGR
jgi:hypothetical protein